MFERAKREERALPSVVQAMIGPRKAGRPKTPDAKRRRGAFPAPLFLFDASACSRDHLGSYIVSSEQGPKGQSC